MIEYEQVRTKSITDMKKLELKELSDNFFESIGKEWMLVTAGTKEKFNTMTASWGGIGWLLFALNAILTNS